MSLSDTLIVAALLGLWPAWIAKNKGHSFVATWTLSMFLTFLIAMPYALWVKDRRPKCPHCLEVVKATATVCPHCTRSLTGIAA